MKLCISSLAWNIKNRIKIYELLEKNNILHIEVVPNKISNMGLYDSKKNYLNLKKEWEYFNINAVSMQSIHFGLKDLSLFGNSKERDRLFYSTVKAMEISNILEIDHIVFGSPKLRIFPIDMKKERVNDIAIDFFYNLGNMANKYGCILGLEANSKKYGANFITNTYEACNFLKEVNHKNININLDLSTIILENEDICESINMVDSISREEFHSHISVPFLENNYYVYLNDIMLYISKLRDSKAKYCSIEMKETEDENFNMESIKKAILFFKGFNYERNSIV